MKQNRVWTVFYCTNIVMMSILLHGCAGTTHTHTTPSVPLVVTTETHTKVEELVKNPETAGYEMMVVSEEWSRTVSTDPPRTPNAHTNHGHSTGGTDWAVYALSLFIIGVNLYLLSN